MTALVSLLFIAMIPIDCKITNFSLHLYSTTVLYDNYDPYQTEYMSAEKCI